jgi:general secretion pathway protein G
MVCHTNSGRRTDAGFTILELLVVLTIIGTLLSLAAPSYFRSVDKARESVLRENLNTIRSSLDRHYADLGVYPASLEDLVAKRYLRRIPEDPLAGNGAAWRVIEAADKEKGVVADVRSSATGKAADGSWYRNW